MKEILCIGVNSLDFTVIQKELFAHCPSAHNYQHNNMHLSKYLV